MREKKKRKKTHVLYRYNWHLITTHSHVLSQGHCIPLVYALRFFGSSLCQYDLELKTVGLKRK